MQLGRYMRELWGQKIGLALVLLAATLGATMVLFHVSFFPPSLGSKSLDLASASTEVVVDTPRSSIVDLRQDTYAYLAETNRALLLGNVMASRPVRNYIGIRAGLPPSEIRISPPVTPEQPRVVTTSSESPKTSDIFRSPDEYRINIEANPTVPILDIYTEAPTASSAESLADAAVKGLGDYLRGTAQRQATPLRDKVKLTQLGRARGEVINEGASLQLAFAVFVIVLFLGSTLVIYFSRVRRGWSATSDPHPDPA
jgi:hypothetical protein